MLKNILLAASAKIGMAYDLRSMPNANLIAYYTTGTLNQSSGDWNDKTNNDNDLSISANAATPEIHNVQTYTSSGGSYTVPSDIGNDLVLILIRGYTLNFSSSATFDSRSMSFVDGYTDNPLSIAVNAIEVSPGDSGNFSATGDSFIAFTISNADVSNILNYVTTKDRTDMSGDSVMAPSITAPNNSIVITASSWDRGSTSNAVLTGNGHTLIGEVLSDCHTVAGYANSDNGGTFDDLTVTYETEDVDERAIVAVVVPTALYPEVQDGGSEYANANIVTFANTHKYISSSSPNVAQDFTILLIGDCGNTDSIEVLFSSNEDGDSLVQFNTNNQIEIYGGSDYAQSSFDGTIPNIYELYFNGPNSHIYVNGEEDTNSSIVDIGSVGLQGFRIGASANDTLHFEGRLGEIGVVSGGLSSEDRDLYMRYFTENYNIEIFPTVTNFTNTENESSGSTLTVDIPELKAKQSAYVVISAKSGPTPTISAPDSSWYKIGQFNFTGARGAFFVKKFNTDQSNTTVDFTSSEDVVFGSHVYIIENWSGNTEHVEIESLTSSIDSTPTPPSLTPSFGTSKALWFTHLIFVSGSSDSITAFPTNFTGGQQENHIDDGAADLYHGSCYRLLEANTISPGDWTKSVSGGNAVLATVCFRPINIVS